MSLAILATRINSLKKGLESLSRKPMRTSGNGANGTGRMLRLAQARAAWLNVQRLLNQHRTVDAVVIVGPMSRAYDDRLMDIARTTIWASQQCRSVAYGQVQKELQSLLYRPLGMLRAADRCGAALWSHHSHPLHQLVPTLEGMQRSCDLASGPGANGNMGLFQSPPEATTGLPSLGVFSLDP